MPFLRARVDLVPSGRRAWLGSDSLALPEQGDGDVLVDEQPRDVDARQDVVDGADSNRHEAISWSRSVIPASTLAPSSGSVVRAAPLINRY